MGECGSPGDVNSNVLIARSTGDAQLDKAVWQWLSWDKGIIMTFPTRLLEFITWRDFKESSCEFLKIENRLEKENWVLLQERGCRAGGSEVTL